MKNEKSAEAASGNNGKPPEHGADSQLHCYNAVSWRLAELFDIEDDSPASYAGVSPAKP